MLPHDAGLSNQALSELEATLIGVLHRSLDPAAAAAAAAAAADNCQLRQPRQVQLVGYPHDLGRIMPSQHNIAE